jgi:hypothetical protein
MGRVASERRQKRQRVIKLNQETSQALSEQVEAFRRKFGREPSGDDPIFFDPDSDVPRPYPLDRVNLELAAAAARAGIDPAKVYAIQKTG